LSNSTIDEMVTKSAVATTTTTLFLSEQHHNSSSGCDGAGGGGCHSGQLDQLRSAAYWTSLTHLEGGGGCPPDSQGRLSTTMPREKVVLLPEKVSPSLHASLPRPARQSHSESCRASTVSMPGSPPPYVHPKSQEKDCSCPCECRSSAYPSQEVSFFVYKQRTYSSSEKLSTL
jgi:hypothetical protein